MKKNSRASKCNVLVAVAVAVAVVEVETVGAVGIDRKDGETVGMEIEASYWPYLSLLFKLMFQD